MKDRRSLFVRAVCTVGALKGLLILGVAAAFVVTTDPAHAGPLPSTSTYATLLQDISLCRGGCGGTTSSEMAFTDFYGNRYLALASAGFGSVGAEVSVNAGGIGRGRQVFAESEGSFIDNITITDPTGTGSIIFAVDLHGTAITTLPGVVDPALSFVFGVTGPTASGRIDVRSVVDGYPSRTFMTAPIAYTFGDTITIFMVLDTALIQQADGDGTTPLIANLLYRNTATLTGLTVLDAQGVPISNYSISSESGTSYPLSSVPEPSSAWLLVASGLILFSRQPLVQFRRILN